jgi:hypothetical protein
VQVHRIIVRFAALLGLALALTVGSAPLAGAQYEGGYEGDYEGQDDCPPGYEGYAGYEGCGEGTDGGTPGGESAAPPPAGGSLGGSLPETGGVVLLGLAGAVAVSGLALRRLIST